MYAVFRSPLIAVSALCAAMVLLVRPPAHAQTVQEPTLESSTAIAGISDRPDALDRAVLRRHLAAPTRGQQAEGTPLTRIGFVGSLTDPTRGRYSQVSFPHMYQATVQSSSTTAWGYVLSNATYVPGQCFEVATAQLYTHNDVQRRLYVIDQCSASIAFVKDLSVAEWGPQKKQPFDDIFRDYTPICMGIELLYCRSTPVYNVVIQLDRHADAEKIAIVGYQNDLFGSLFYLASSDGTVLNERPSRATAKTGWSELESMLPEDFDCMAVGSRGGDVTFQRGQAFYTAWSNPRIVGSSQQLCGQGPIRSTRSWAVSPLTPKDLSQSWGAQL